MPADSSPSPRSALMALLPGSFIGGGLPGFDDGGIYYGDDNMPAGQLAARLGGIAAASLLLCCTVHAVCYLLVSKLSTRYPKLLERPTAAERRRAHILWAEKVVSSMHAAFVGCLAAYLWMSGAWAGNVWRHPPLGDFCLAGHVGYSVYDMIAMYFYGETADMWLHHAMSCSGSILMGVYRVMAFFPVALMASELTVLPSNVNWALRNAGLPRSSPLFRWNARVRVASYFVFRTFIGPAMVLYALRTESFYTLMPKVVITVPIITFTFLALLSVMNIIWTRGLLRSYAKLRNIWAEADAKAAAHKKE
eukprot:PLAT2580.1.p1 GENE.PLAT2580.1~~PLAT2580.1.p1  ORF type:complete len:327 (+),score=100.02 PLAT2580.1:61-981(+)